MHSDAGRYFLLGLIAIAGILVFYIAQPFLSALALAAVFAVVLQPIYRIFSMSLKKWHGTAAVLTVLFGVIVIILPLIFVGARIVSEATNVYISLSSASGKEMISDTIQSLERGAGAYIPGIEGYVDAASARVPEYARAALQWLLQNSGAAVAGLATTLLSTFVFIIALFYLLKDGGSFRRAVIEFSPLRDRYDERVFDRLHLAINSVVRGSLLIALIQGFATTIGLMIFGIPNAVLWGSVAALAALLPGIGTSVVFIPIILYSFTVGNTAAAVGLAIWGATAVGLVDNFLTPRLIGSGIKLHPLLVMVSVLGGLMFFGPMGIFFGPLTLSLLFALLSIYTESQTRGDI